MEIKTVKDYIDLILEKFPNISKKDIKKIVEHGWRLYFIFNTRGCDVLIENKNIWTYSGRLTYDSLFFNNYYKLKLIKRMRLLYRRRKIKYQGYYYFGLTDEQWNNYLSLKKRNGRPKKIFNFGNITLYKLLDECKLKEYGATHLFRVPYISDFGFKLRKFDYKSDKAELIEVRDVPKLKDILVSNNKYEII